MAKYDWLREVVIGILGTRPRCFWLSYQIAEHLKKTNREDWRRLQEQCGGRDCCGPAKAISQCLKNHRNRVEIAYIKGSGLKVTDIEAPAQRMAIFRLPG